MGLWRQDPRFAPLPGWLLEVVEPVLSDVQQPTPIELMIGFQAPRTLWLSEPGERGVAGFEPWDEGDPERSPRVIRVIEFADWIQEQFLFESSGAWGQARPACPGHSHPASAVEVDGEAWWGCPYEDRPIAPIGKLTHGPSADGR
jgi:hypothetical protein